MRVPYSIFVLLLALYPLLLEAQPPKPQLASNPLLIKVTLAYQTTSIAKILSDIQLKYKVNFSYVDDFIPLEKKVTINLTQQELNLVLGKIFNGTAVKYYLISDQIVLVQEKTTQTILLNNVNKNPTKSDSLKVYPLYNRYREAGTPIKFFKISLKQFLNAIPEFDQLQKNAPPPAIKKDTSSTKTPSGDSVVKKERERVQTLHGPEIALPPRHSKKVHFGFSITPQFVSWMIKSNKSYATHVSQRNRYNANFGISAGADIFIPIADKMEVTSALQYTFLTHSGTYKDSLLNVTYNANFIIPRRYYEVLHYISIPLKITYKISERDFTSSISAGLGANILLAKDAVPNHYAYQLKKYENYRIDEFNPPAPNRYFWNRNLNEIIPPKKNIQPVALSILIAYNISIPLPDNNVLCISPTFQYFPMSFYKSDAPVSERAVSCGLTICYVPGNIRVK